MKILTVVGARPQFIKAAAFSRVARRRHTEILVHTGQHYDAQMSDVFFDELALPQPDHHLGVGSGPHGRQTAQMLERLEDVLRLEAPDVVVIYGDTNSTLAGALAAAKLNIPLAHVEAGLRSGVRTMPEELNRIVADSVSAYLFAPTAAAVGNLVAEGHVVVADGALVVEGSEAGIWRTEARPAGPAIAVGHAGAGDEAAPGDAREARGGRLEAGVRQTAASGVEPPASVRELGGAAASAARGRIYRTGDIMYDALLLQAPAAAARSPIIDELSLAPRGYALATVHRAANTDDPARLERLLDALASLGEPVVLPMHPRTRAALAHSDIEVGAAVRVIDPVGYRDMLALEQQARVILTDSGGVQKEAYLLGVPCVTLRDETEWTETLADGWNILAGDAPERILAAARRPRPEREPAPVFGDGHAAERMLAAIEAR